MSGPENVLQVVDLVKNYGSFRAVDSISFSVPRGKIVGFLGPNGAGKTTTIQILLGITTQNGGSVTYFGKDFATHRLESLQRINSASAFNTLLGRVTVYENLRVYADLYRVPTAERKIANLLKRFEIEDIASNLYWGLSSGQKTRVNLAKSLINDPEILLMDEPTASLDPDIADKTLSLIEELRAETGLSILYTSHNMQEITRICDEVIFLDRGRIVAQDTPRNLVRTITSAKLVVAFTTGKDVGVDEFVRSRGLKHRWLDDNRIEVPTEEAAIPEFLYGLSKAGSAITDIEVVKPTLEDVFLQIARSDV